MLLHSDGNENTCSATSRLPLPRYCFQPRHIRNQPAAINPFPHQDLTHTTYQKCTNVTHLCGNTCQIEYSIFTARAALFLRNLGEYQINATRGITIPRYGRIMQETAQTSLLIYRSEAIAHHRLPMASRASTSTETWAT